jgi:cytochrome c oxidase cbb3-type subunit IV
MDINDLRSAVTVASLIAFLAIVFYAWSQRRHADYERAAMLPFSGDFSADAAHAAAPAAAKTTSEENHRE